MWEVESNGIRYKDRAMKLSTRVGELLRKAALKDSVVGNTMFTQLPAILTEAMTAHRYQSVFRGARTVTKPVFAVQNSLNRRIIDLPN